MDNYPTAHIISDMASVILLVDINRLMIELEKIFSDEQPLAQCNFFCLNIQEATLNVMIILSSKRVLIC
jgi:predicted methyltransferase